MGQVLLDYDRSIRPQTTGWSCGPASTEIVLTSKGISVTEAQLIRDIGTDQDGTDFVGLIVDNAFHRYAPDAKYTAVYLEQDPCTEAQKEALWGHIVQSISNGWGLVMNWVVPPNNRPRSVPPSTQDLAYPNAWIWHYVACMGFDDTGQRKVWIADPGFAPGGAWISFDQVSTLIPPKGYCYASAFPAVTPKPEQPDQPDHSGLDAVVREVTQRLPGRSFEDDNLRTFVQEKTTADTLLGHSVNAASLARVNYSMLYRICRKLGVDVSDIK